MAARWPRNREQVYHELLCRATHLEWWGASPRVMMDMNSCTYLLSSAVRTVWRTGYPQSQRHNRIISVRHYRHCLLIDLNATSKRVSLSSPTHPIQRYKDHTLSILRIQKGVIHLNRALNFFYILAPCGYHTPNHKFLMTAVTAHSNDLMPHRLNQRFCEMTIKGVCWSCMQSVGAAV